MKTLILLLVAIIFDAMIEKADKEYSVQPITNEGDRKIARDRIYQTLINTKPIIKTTSKRKR